MRVAINGFGRIGRLAIRKLYNNPDVDIVAINSTREKKLLAHLLKYDSTQGILKDEIGYTEDSIIIGGKEIKIVGDRNPANLPWKELNIDVVLECTGAFNDSEAAMAHIDAGAKKVLISAPAKGDVKMIVYNVNHDKLDGSEKIISAASCTTNCLAPMVKVLNDNFGIRYGLMTTVHAYTQDQNALDAPHRDLRRARASAVSIIPTSTGAAKAIGKVIPELEGRLDGYSQRVPVPTGSITELVSLLNKEVTIEEVNAAMKAAQSESFGYNIDPIVSADIVGIEYGSLFDATLTTMVGEGKEQMLKTVAWYDNEMSYVSQMIRVLLHLRKLM